MLKKDFPNACLYFGSVGNDETSEIVKREVEKEGLQASWSVAEGLDTARCAVVVHEAERALCCDVAASNKYKTSHMLENIHLLEPAKIIYSTGFFIISNYEALKIAALSALNAGKIFAMNLSAVYVC